MNSSLAGVAQLVERDLAKVEVTGSSPATRFLLTNQNFHSKATFFLKFFLYHIKIQKNSLGSMYG